MTSRSLSLVLLAIGFLLIGAAGWYAYRQPTQANGIPDPHSLPPARIETSTVPSESPRPTPMPTPAGFDGQRAYADVHTQVGMGPRIPGSEGHARIQDWLQEELARAGWRLEIQTSQSLGHPIENLVASRTAEPPQIIVGAHYDTRMFADSDPDSANQSLPVPGANDGASGVAVLLELARTLPQETVPVWLVFFDAEDNGRLEGWDWILGSREFVRTNTVRPAAVIIVDMIGDADLNIYKDRSSSPDLTDAVWAVAKDLGHEDAFIPEYYSTTITDDHTPFVEAGIPAIDIIDFSYPYWHTVEDTPDKVSAESLQAVGETLRTWIMQQTSQP